MSVVQYPKLAYYLVAETSTVLLGSYEIPRDGDLQHAQIRVFHKKTGAYSYAMKLVLSASANGPALVESETVTFSDETTGQTTSDWLGEVFFTFPEYALVATETYFVRLVATGYARAARPNENTGYLAVGCDWLDPIGTDDTGGARMPIGALV